MNLRRALLAAVVLAAAVLLVPAVARAYYLQNADVAVRVAPNGALQVTEPTILNVVGVGVSYVVRFTGLRSGIGSTARCMCSPIRRPPHLP